MRALVYSRDDTLFVEFLSLDPDPVAVLYLERRGYQRGNRYLYFRTISGDTREMRKAAYRVTLHLRRLGYDVICRTAKPRT